MAKDRETTSGSRRQLIRRRIHDLYESNKPEAVRFRYALLAFDVAMITFIVLSSFVPGHALVELLDVLFGIGVLVDFAARIWASDNRRHEVLSLAGIADLVDWAFFRRDENVVLASTHLALFIFLARANIRATLRSQTMRTHFTSPSER